MKLVKRVIEPQLRNGLPIWFHRSGIKCVLKRFDRGPKTILIANNVASLTISPASVGEIARWSVEWSITPHSGETTSGERFFSSEELAAAFGLSSKSDEDSHLLLERYGASSASQGKYGCWKRSDESVCLVVPCFGTGQDDDPNMSILADPKMMAAVKELLKPV